METLKSILISVALTLVVMLAVALALLLTDIGHTILQTLAGFAAWVIINFAFL